MRSLLVCLTFTAKSIVFFSDDNHKPCHPITKLHLDLRTDIIFWQAAYHQDLRTRQINHHVYKENPAFASLPRSWAAATECD
ncbi:MAG: hypothetical protein DSM106950_05445 [Stigonema ocellatum SAG 48.90 = DSM 106950]|nr:hypothetical protein [Stigonema ocellatum SAG 48.90 = DSM 106950]